MHSIRRRGALALAGIAAAAAFAAPMAAQADAAVKIRVFGNAKVLTDYKPIGFATMSRDTAAAIQRWNVLDAPGSGPARIYQNVGTQMCLRANPNTNVVVRTRTCDGSSSEQQWVQVGSGSTMRIHNLATGLALTVDFWNINDAVGLAGYDGRFGQHWVVSPG
jgi:hypothetical protein